MATQTEKLGLLKPTYDEPADIAVLNENADKIDAFAKAFDKKKINNVIFNGTQDITVYSPNDTNIGTTLGSKSGWIKICKITGLVTSGFACNFKLTQAYSNSMSQTVECSINSRFAGISIVQLNGSVPTNATITKLRVVSISESEKHIEVYKTSAVTNPTQYQFYNFVFDGAYGKPEIVCEVSTATSGTEFTFATNGVKASRFEGNLAGNADTATYANTATYLSKGEWNRVDSSALGNIQYILDLDSWYLIEACKTADEKFCSSFVLHTPLELSTVAPTYTYSSASRGVKSGTTEDYTYVSVDHMLNYPANSYTFSYSGSCDYLRIRKIM